MENSQDRSTTNSDFQYNRVYLFSLKTVHAEDDLFLTSPIWFNYSGFGILDALFFKKSGIHTDVPQSTSEGLGEIIFDYYKNETGAFSTDPIRMNLVVFRVDLY